MFVPSSFGGNFFTAGNFDPLNEDPLVFWDSDNGITLSSNDVTAWSPYVGSPATMVGTVTFYPQLLGIPELNGHPVLRFDAASNESMTIQNLVGANTDHYWCFVLKPRSTTGSQYIIDHNGGLERITLTSSVSASGKFGINDGATFSEAPSAHPLEWMVVEHVNHGGTGKVYVNGVEVFSRSYSTTQNYQGNIGFFRYWGGFSSTHNADVVAVFYKQPTSTASNANLVAGFFNRYNLGYRFVFDGDSHTAELGGPSPPANSMPTLVSSNYNGIVPFLQDGVSGHTLANMDANATAIDALPNTSRDKKILVVWGGYNDILNDSQTPAQAYARLKTYLTNRLAANSYRAIYVLTLPPGFNTAMTTSFFEYNQLIRDGLSDLQANYGVTDIVDINTHAALDADGDYNDTTYFQTDKVHLNQTGTQLVADMVIAAIDTIYTP